MKAIEIFVDFQFHKAVESSSKREFYQSKIVFGWMNGHGDRNDMGKAAFFFNYQKQKLKKRRGFAKSLPIKKTLHLV